MKLKMRLLALLLVVVMVVGLVPTVWATDSETELTKDESTEEAAISAYAENEAILLAADAATTITSPLYYLDGTDWNMGTNSVSITKSGASSAMGTYVTNATVITEADIKALADSNSDVDLVIYARPGMALGFASGTTWPDTSWVLTDSESGKYKYTNWEWVWNGSVNYAILANNTTAVTSATFDLVEDDTATTDKEICKVQVYIIPENPTPTLVDRNRVKTIDVTLYNYDGKKFNEYYSSKNQAALIFANYSKGVSAHAGLASYSWSGTNQPNSGSISTGIMKSELGADNLPEMKHSQNTDLFSTDTLGGAKAVYENVKMEFIYDPASAYYYYSSNLNHAQFFERENRIKLYNETLAPQFLVTTSATEQMDKAGFYPFADINKAFSAYATPNADYKNWNDPGVLSSDYFQQKALLVKDIVATGSITPASTIDMHFGLQMEVDFYMPTGRQNDANNDGIKEDLIYSFTGDDDLWIYVDDKLVLDIGGAHTAVNGVINFTNKTVTVSNSGDVKYENGTYTATGTTGARSWTFAELGLDFTEDQMHTMRVFYLERWSGVSNCRMHFNLPVVPKNSVVVSKNVLNQDGEVPSIPANDTYEFEVYTRNLKNYDTSDDNFTRKDNFTLKDGEHKVIEGIDRFTEVYVVEKNPNGTYIYPGASVSINGANAVPYKFDEATSTQEMQQDSNITFNFTNTIQTYDLSIDKHLINNEGAEPSSSEKYTFNVKINDAVFTGDAKIGNDIVTLSPEGNIELTVDQIATIDNIPAKMSYSVEECTLPTAPNGYKYEAAQYMNQSGTITSDTTVTVTNTLVALFGNLTISKTGISDLDHEASGEERQSTIFNISGTSDSGVEINMDVVIHGNDTITIVDLPVGTYTVTEKTSWSWRYTPGEESKEVEITGGQTTATSFENTRQKVLWLSGDNFWKNLFNGKNPNPAPVPTPTVATN